MPASPAFSHFANTRHVRWTIIGVADEDAPTEVGVVEIFAPGNESPSLRLAVSDLPQFIAGLTASALAGDLTAG